KQLWTGKVTQSNIGPAELTRLFVRKGSDKSFTIISLGNRSGYPDTPQFKSKIKIITTHYFCSPWQNSIKVNKSCTGTAELRGNIFYAVHIEPVSVLVHMYRNRIDQTNRRTIPYRKHNQLRKSFIFRLPLNRHLSPLIPSCYPSGSCD